MSIFNSSYLGIGLAIGLRNNFSAPAAQVTASMNQMQAAAQRAARTRLQMTRDYNLIGAGIGGAALVGMKEWIIVGSEFGYTMAAVKAAAESTNAEFKTLDATARKLGKQTMFSSRDVASGMKFMAMAGQTSSEINENIKAATALAGATQSELGGKHGAADILTNIMMAYNATPDQSMRYADVLTQATIKSNTDILDLAEALKYSSSTLNTMGYSIEESTAMAMVLGNAGMRGSMAGTAIEKMVRYMTRAASEARTGKQGDALASLGLQPEQLMDAQGNLLNMRELLKLLAAQMNNMGNVQQQTILNDIFGVRGNRAAALIIRNLGTIDKMYNEVAYGASGRSNTVLNQMMNTLHGTIDRVVSGFEDFKISWTKGIEPVLKLGLGVVEKLLDGITAVLNIPFVGPFVSTSVTGWLLMKTVSMAYRGAISGIRLIYGANQTAMANQAATTVAGYASMSNAAYRYAAAARVSGVAATTGMAGAGGFFASGVLGMTRNGRFFRRNAAGGATFINTALGQRYLQRYGSRVTGSALSRGIAGVAVPGLARVVPLLSRLLGFLGGPWGMLLMVGLPALFSGLSSMMEDNTDELEDNTTALENANKVKVANATDLDAYSLGNYSSRRYDINRAIGENIWRAQVEKDLIKMEKGASGVAVNQNIDIYIDNEKQIKRKLVAEKMEEQFKLGIR